VNGIFPVLVCRYYYSRLVDSGVIRGYGMDVPDDYYPVLAGSGEQLPNLVDVVTYCGIITIQCQLTLMSLEYRCSIIDCIPSLWFDVGCERSHI
jgi:hypothetical protein